MTKARIRYGTDFDGDLRWKLFEEGLITEEDPYDLDDFK